MARFARAPPPAVPRAQISVCTPPGWPCPWLEPGGARWPPPSPCLGSSLGHAFLASVMIISHFSAVGGPRSPCPCICIRLQPQEPTKTPAAYELRIHLFTPLTHSDLKRQKSAPQGAYSRIIFSHASFYFGSSRIHHRCCMIIRSI